MNITISIIIPSQGKRPEMLAETLASIQAQTVPAHEVIVVDFPDDLPGNQARRINWGVKKSTGTHYLFMGDDDLLLPNFIEKMTEFAREGYDIVSTGFENFGEQEGVHYPGTGPLCSTIVKREMYDKTQGYDPEADVACDGEFYRQCLELGAKWNNVANVYLYRTRVHSGQYSRIANWEASNRYIENKHRK